MKREEELKQITDTLYKLSTNLTGRIQTRPSQNEKIDTKNLSIDRLNIGADGMDGKWYWRVSFTGSVTWYQMPIPDNRLELAFKKMIMIIELLVDSTDIYGVATDEEKDIEELPF